MSINQYSLRCYDVLHWSCLIFPLGTVSRSMQGLYFAVQLKRGGFRCESRFNLPFYACLGGPAGSKAPPAEFQTTLWAVSCMACHGTDGHAQGVSMSLSGRPSQELYDTLLAFKSGERTATIMHQHAKGYSDEELKRIAQYFSQIK